MDTLLGFLARGIPLLPAVAVVVLAALSGRLARRLYTRGQGDASAPDSFRQQLTYLMITLVAAVSLLVVLPVDAQLRGQLLSLFGIVLSAAIALSATTFVGNIMAGLMLKAVKNFRNGDFVEVGDKFGRVTMRGLLSTEIQTEFRDLVTIPNLHLVTHPVKTVRASGTLVSAEVSLGYDVPHQRVETLLEQAAVDAGLTEPTMLVMHLGDFSVTYRVVGLLTEVKRLLTVRSLLRRAILDSLHGAGVEIVSPAFMNQRVLEAGRPVIAPDEPDAPTAVDEPPVEDLAFDKAEEAENLEQLQAEHTRTREAIAALADADQSDPSGTARQQEALARRLARVEASMAKLRQQTDD